MNMERPRRDRVRCNPLQAQDLERLRPLDVESERFAWEKWAIAFVLGAVAVVGIVRWIEFIG
jgi:hypothetical protein